MKKFSIYISKKSATDLLRILDDVDFEDKSFVSSLSKIVNDSGSEITNQGRDISDNSKKTSKNHKIISKIHMACYPFHNVNQNVYLSLDMNGRQTKCEFDIVDKTYNLVIEIHGRQHYEFVPFFHETKADFVKQKVRDDEKKNWAILNGWIYLAIPEKDALRLDKLFKEDPELVSREWTQLIDNKIKQSDKIKKEILEG